MTAVTGRCARPSPSIDAMHGDRALPSIPISLIALAALLVAATAPVDAATAENARRWGALSFEPCALSPEGLALTVPAQCTTLSVPEDRAKPGGRKIDLAIAWI